MSMRADGWNESLAGELRKPQFANQFAKNLIAAGHSPETVIRRAVRAYGVKELAEKVGMLPESVSRVLRNPANAKPETLRKIGKPFGLKLKVEIKRSFEITRMAP